MTRNMLYLLLGFSAYLATLIGSQRILAAGVDDAVLRTILTLAPMLPAVFICAAIVLTIRAMDELQRKVQFEAIAIAFAGTALITFGYGFLEGTGSPRLSMFVVWPIMGALWFVGVLIGRLRYG